MNTNDSSYQCCHMLMSERFHLRTTVPFVTAHLEIFHCTHHPVILSGDYMRNFRHIVGVKIVCDYMENFQPGLKIEKRMNENYCFSPG